MALAAEIRSKASLVAHWRLGIRDVWRHGGIADAIPANVSRTAGRHYGTAQGALTIGGGLALSSTDALADSTVFSGLSADYLRVDHHAALSLVGNLTLLAIVKPTSFADYRMLVAKTNGATAAPFHFYLSITTGVPFFYAGNGATETAVAGTAGLAAGAASFVAVTVSAGTVTHYLNGAANGSGSLGAQAISDAGQALYIGRRADGFPFAGPMGEVAMFNAALSASELLAFAVLGGFA